MPSVRAILAAFDTGTGSTSMGRIIQHYSLATAFGVAAAISALAVPHSNFSLRPSAFFQNPTFIPTSSLRPGIEAVGWPKNGDVITPE